MKRLFLFLLLISQLTIAQDYNFGEVSRQELLEEFNPVDPEANATVLYRKHNISFNYVQQRGFVQSNEIHERIKIYNKEGFNQATKQVRLYVGSSNDINEKISNLKAYTYTLEDNKIVKNKLKKDGIFKEENNQYWETTKFTMPNISEGCIIEYKYIVETQSGGINDIELQQFIPIKKLEFELKTPEYYKYKTLLNPKAEYNPEFKKSSKTEKITFAYRKEANPGMGGSLKSELIKYDRDVVFDKVSANADNIPALKKEEFVDNINNYKSKLIMELNSLNYPNEPVKSLSTSWEKVTSMIYNDSDFGNQLNKKNYYSKAIDALIENETDQSIKASKIYNFVKQKMTWNDYLGYTTNQGVSKAFKEGTGNVAEINLMLISMLRYAKINANPVLVSTKSNGIPLLPTRTGFNYVVCAIETGNSLTLLDATEQNTTFNILPYRTLNWLGRIIRENGTSEFIELVPKTKSKDAVSLNAIINSDLTIEGKVRSVKNNYQAYNYRNKHINQSTESIIKNLEDGEDGLTVANYSNKNIKDFSKPVSISYDYTLEDNIEEIGDKLYLNPLLFFKTEENPFKADSRQYPIDFVCPLNDKYIINIKIPEGYKIGNLPTNTKVVFNENEGEFSYMAKDNKNTIQLIVSFNLNISLIPSSSYAKFKEFYQLMIDKKSEKIVLVKA